MAKTLTDDAIDDVIVDLADYVQRHFAVNINEDRIYDSFSDFVFNLLEDYSNGYRNYN